MSFSYLFLLSVFTLISRDKQFIYQNDPSVCGIYCTMSKDYFFEIFQQNFDVYYFQKSLVSLLTNIVLLIFNLQSSPETINSILEGLSLFSLFIASFFWWRIANTTKLTGPNYWIVFAGLFGSQLFIKISPYSQDGSDNASFALGMAVLYCIVSKSCVGIWICYFLSFLVQPQLHILIVPLLLFRGFDYNSQTRMKIKSKTTKRLTTLIFFSVFISSVLIFTFWLPLSHGVNHVIIPLLPISIAISSFFLSKVLYPLLSMISISAIIRHILSIKKIMLVLFSIELVFRVLVDFIGRGEIMSINSTISGQAYFLLGNYYHAVAMPLLWLVAPFLFFGPFAILIWIFYKEIFSSSLVVKDFGFAISLILIVFLLPNTESRHHIAYLPWLFYLLVRRVNFRVSYIIYLFTPLMLVTSRFYGTYASTNQPYDKFLMSWGPWMSQEVYLLGTIILIPLCLAHYLFQDRLLSGSLALGNTKAVDGENSRYRKLFPKDERL